MHIVVGTAGHIDHGKSALVKVLTGTDPDRLKEEKERGMTTDLGFVFLGDNVTIIDVPGHEKFVRHMLAGASTIDMVLLVVAADDGVMPQTVEHFDICRLMGIKKGLVAITKADLVEEEWLELVRSDVARLVAGSFLEKAPVAVVSSVTGQGIPELRQELDGVIQQVKQKPDRGVFRLSVDRCFTIKGFGTVVAGTVLSGQCRVGDRLELLPQQQPVRVRGVQRHERPIEKAVQGDRAALNLQGVEKKAAKRGNVLATPGYYVPTTCLNGSLYLLKSAGRPLRNMTRVRLHIGTAEVMCRVVLLDAKELGPGQDALVQYRLEQPVVCDWNDHYVIRSYSPQRAIGGGVVLEPNAERERRFDDTTVTRLNALRAGDTGTVLEQHLVKSKLQAGTRAGLARTLALAEADTTRLLNQLVGKGLARSFEHEGREYVVHEKNFQRARDAVVRTLEKFHQANPVRLGMKRPELRAKAATVFSVPLFEAVVAELVKEGKLVVENDRFRLSSHQVRLKPEEQEVFDKAEGRFREGGFSPPGLNDVLAGVNHRLSERVKTALFETGVLVELGESVVFHREVVAQARERIVNLFRTKDELTASEIRKELGTTRRYVIPLLNHFDSAGLTQRKGDKRVLRRGPE